jgi:hypothetical protein
MAVQEREYRNWEAEAREFLTRWKRVDHVPTLQTPMHHRWESATGDESNTLIAWSREQYDHAWTDRIHERIGAAILADPGLWKYQKPFYGEIYRKFFNPPDGRFVFNAVIVTPDRLPMRLWKKLITGRERIEEVTIVKGKVAPTRPNAGFTLTGMSFPLEISLEHAVWARQPKDGKQKCSFAVAHTQRNYKGLRLTVKRLCQVDFADENETSLLKNGKIPALEEDWVKGKEDGRVMAPMVQLFRVDECGETDLLVLETSFASGALVDIRWSHQDLAPFLNPHPYYAAALNAACSSKEKLIQG